MNSNTTITINKQDIPKIEKIKKDKKLRNTNDVCQFLLEEYKWSKEKERVSDNIIKKYEELIQLLVGSKQSAYHLIDKLNCTEFLGIKNVLKSYIPKFFDILLQKLEMIKILKNENFNYRRFEWELKQLLELLISSTNHITQFDLTNFISFEKSLRKFYYLFRSNLTNIDGINLKQLKHQFEYLEERFQKEKNLDKLSFLDQDYVLSNTSEVDKLQLENQNLKNEVARLNEILAKNKKED